MGGSSCLIGGIDISVGWREVCLLRFLDDSMDSIGGNAGEGLNGVGGYHSRGLSLI